MSDVFHTRGALRHLPGIGPKKIEQLRAAGLHTWPALRDHYRDGHLPGLDGRHAGLLQAIDADESALATKNLLHLTNSLHRADHWRILADYPDRATYLDIETSGDELRPEITVVVARHRGALHIFTAGRDLDRFLDLLDDITLLVTFNGATFDVPQLENHFHLPMRDIAHVDLRWVCYHAELRGGLKEIERAIGLIRPPDLVGMDGAEADWLWRRWKETGQERLVQRVTRYCAADVIGLEHLSRWIVARQTGGAIPTFDWGGLPEEEQVEALKPAELAVSTRVKSASALERRLREKLRSRMMGR